MEFVNHLVKKKVANAISLFDLDGIPVLSSGKDEKEMENDRLVGGFYTSITTFAQMKNFASSIKLESDNGDIHIIKKNNHFIGALLWNKILNLPLHDSELILDEFLEFMDQNMNSNDPQDISNQISQYYHSL